MLLSISQELLAHHQAYVTSNPADLEARPNLCWKAALGPAEYNIQELLTCRHRRDLFPSCLHGYDQRKKDRADSKGCDDPVTMFVNVGNGGTEDLGKYMWASRGERLGRNCCQRDGRPPRPYHIGIPKCSTMMRNLYASTHQSCKLVTSTCRGTPRL